MLCTNGPELFLGLVSTVGTKTDDVVTYLEDILHQFSYEVRVLSVSKDVIADFDEKLLQQTDEYERISNYMNVGNRIREQSGDNCILMKGIVREIYLSRSRNGIDSQPNTRTAYIIRSLKNPAEVSFMRNVYGSAFHLVGVTSIRNERLRYLTDVKGIESGKAEELLARDEEEDTKYGQQTRETFQLADYFINVTSNLSEIQHNVERLLDLLFGNPFITPTFGEHAMFLAYVTSMRSADLSRQVGAVVANSATKEILTLGTNDCPRYGGGLYWPFKNDKGEIVDCTRGRDYTLGYDSNKIEQEVMIKKILGCLGQEITSENIQRIKSCGIGSLTEYGRVVHAEMEALMCCARNNISCRDATMYVTTFPCHNCAKHIIAAGIRKVVYIEPYPKSKAFEFYKAEISDDIKVDQAVLFEPFIGVGPQRYIDLFAMASRKWYKKKRKDEDGKKVTWKRENAQLRNPATIFNYLVSEVAATAVFDDEIMHERGSDKSYMKKYLRGSQKVRQSIRKWKKWEKEHYNDVFAISNNSRKLD